jgi:hypothetical protein
MKHHTILFNIAAYNVLKLTREEGERVMEWIEDFMNGDGIYGESAERELLLSHYYDQFSYGEEVTWVEMIEEVVSHLYEFAGT